MNVELGEQLKDARQATGRSLQSVAGAAKVSTAYLHKLEGGVVNSPNPRLLLRLAEELQVSYAGLMLSAGYLLPTAEDQAHAARVAATAAGAAASRSADDRDRLQAGNPDIVRLLHEVLARLDALSTQHEALLQAASPASPPSASPPRGSSDPGVA